MKFQEREYSQLHLGQHRRSCNASTQRLIHRSSSVQDVLIGRDVVVVMAESGEVNMRLDDRKQILSLNSVRWVGELHSHCRRAMLRGNSPSPQTLSQKRSPTANT